MPSLKALFFIFGSIICCSSQKYYILADRERPGIDGIFQFVENREFWTSFESFDIRDYICVSRRAKEVELDKCFKHVTKEFYLIFWRWWEEDVPNNEGVVINRFKKSLRYAHGKVGASFGRWTLGDTVILPVDLEELVHAEMERKRNETAKSLSMILAESLTNEEQKLPNVTEPDVERSADKTVQSTVENDTAIHNLREQMRQCEIERDLVHQQNVTIQRLSEHNAQQNAILESKNQAIIICISIISVLGIVCMVSTIHTIYYCILKKLEFEKNRVRESMSLYAINSESRMRQDSVLKKHKLKQKQAKREGDQTVLGRFEPEQFSEAINNLPVVQDAVLDEIMNEMETEGHDGVSETMTKE